MTKTKHRFSFSQEDLLGMTLDNPGGCIACGEKVDGVEPDAHAYECEFCGKPAVYGAQELLIMGLVDIDEEEYH